MLKEEEERRAEIEDDEMLFTYSRDDAYSQVKKHGRSRKIGRPRKHRPVVTPPSSSSSDSDSSNDSSSSGEDEPAPKKPRRVLVNKSSPAVKAVVKKPVLKSDSQASNHVVPQVVKKVGNPVKSPRGRGRPPKVPAVVATQKATTTKYVFVNHSSAAGVNRPIQVAVPHVAMSPSVSLQRPVFATTAVARPMFTTTAVARPVFTTTAVARPMFTTTAVARPMFTTTAVARPTMRIVAPRLRMATAQPVSSVAGWPRIVASPRQIVPSVGTPRQLVTTVGTPPRQVAAGAHGTTPPCQVALVVQPWSNPNLVIRTRRASGQLGPKNVIHVRQRQPLPKVSVVSQFATAGTRTVLLSVPSAGGAPVRLVTSTASPAQNRVLGTPNLVYRHVPNNTVPILEKMALQLRQGDVASPAGGARVLQAAPVAFNLFSRISAAAAQQQHVFIQPQLITVPVPRAPVAHADTNGTLAKDPT